MAQFTASQRHRWFSLFTLALALPLAGSLQAARAATVFSFLSSPYSYVGLGENLLLSPENGVTIEAAYPHMANGVAFSIREPLSPESDSQRYWNLELGGPGSDPLTVGNYEGATRMAFRPPDSPGLDFAGNYRGNNTLTGSFSVLEAVYAEDGSLQSFAADFLQYDEGDPNAWSKGAIRFHSDLPIALTPEPIVLFKPEPFDLGPIAEAEPIVVTDPMPTNEEGEWPTDNWNPPPHYSSGSDSFSGSVLYTMGPSNLASVEVLRVESTPSVSATPGPLPIAAALAGWSTARRLRRRCKQTPEA
ncbi:MAG: hypothetical protein ACKO28_06465 [Cyanobium sp.]